MARNGDDALAVTAPEEVTSGFRKAAFKAFKDADQGSIANNTLTKVTFPAIGYSFGGDYDAANSRYRPPAGLHTFKASVLLTGNTADGAAMLYLLKNGFEFARGQIRPGSSGGTIDINVDDWADGDSYYEVYVYAPTASTISVDGRRLNTWFSAIAA